MDVGFRMRLYGTKFFWFSTRPIRRLYGYLFRPKGRAVKVIVQDGNKILLARINYKHHLWTIPGGTVRRTETYEEAAHREIIEELGIQLHSLKYVGEYTHMHNFREMATKVFTALPIDKATTVDGIEISEAAWFPLDALPNNRRLPNVDDVITLAGLKPLRVVKG